MRRGGGSKAVWNFSENSSVLVGRGFPKPMPELKPSFSIDVFPETERQTNIQYIESSLVFVGPNYPYSGANLLLIRDF